MGSGSRIEHQHHTVAVTRPSTELASEEAVAALRNALQRERPAMAIIFEDPMAPLARMDLVEAPGTMVWFPESADFVRETVTDERDALVAVQGSTVPESGSGFFPLDGEVRVSRDTDGRLAVAPGDVRCGLQEPHQTDADGLCEHQRMVGQLVQDRLNAPSSAVTDRLAAQEVLDEVAAEHAASVAEQERLRAEHAAQPLARSYSEDFDAFQEAYDQAQARRRAGEPAVPYLTENATGGLGARDGGRAFGLELEFDFPPTMNYMEQQRAKEAIARDMHQAGLSPDPYIHGWHASARAGYTDDANAWRMEHDSTVAGEIVSPILYDEPQTWNNLATMCDIIQRHGGVASARTGGHVHVSVPDYDHNVENHNRLLGTVSAYEDVVYRLAHNPDRRQHRGLRWCEPNRAPSRAYTSVGSVRSANNSHHIGLNFQSVTGSSGDHAEFRMWDGSLNPGVIQAQVNVSLGLANASLREAGTDPLPPREPVGSQRAALSRDGLSRRRLSGERWQQSTATFRSMVDRIFTREENRAQATALFAATRWHRGRA
ncbi:amidoligase family protein [Streptomyces sp. NPDC020667]|uniref:amidoligase family protein n=1 Tax=Streptomyces sp. NPDC020667 TaxID=3154895 RepID=UPI0033E5DE9B